jgi:hypothetical protein
MMPMIRMTKNRTSRGTNVAMFVKALVSALVMEISDFAG